MLLRRQPDIRPSEITPQQVFKERRRWVQAMAAMGAIGSFPAEAFSLFGSDKNDSLPPNPPKPESFKNLIKGSPYSVMDKPNSLEEITNYNNFIEFGPNKTLPAKYAAQLPVRPWTVVIDGLVKKPVTFDIDTLLKKFPLEERIYRLRCVEAWSMVIPWVGFPLASLIKQVEPLGSAKFVQFDSFYDKKIMASANLSSIQLPYQEGLRMDEAMHPLTLVAVGLYGDVLPRQNGAPLRMVIPWKYGFKGAKSIIRITFSEKMPATTWNKQQPEEYGFYANVNPNVDHPRWSQAKERHIGDLMRYPTAMFNGYKEQVASLYSGMDLAKYY